jgi:hypothetical protein
MEDRRLKDKGSRRRFAMARQGRRNPTATARQRNKNLEFEFKPGSGGNGWQFVERTAKDLGVNSEKVQPQII